MLDRKVDRRQIAGADDAALPGVHQNLPRGQGQAGTAVPEAGGSGVAEGQRAAALIFFDPGLG